MCLNYLEKLRRHPRLDRALYNIESGQGAFLLGFHVFSAMLVNTNLLPILFALCSIWLQMEYIGNN